MIEKGRCLLTGKRNPSKWRLKKTIGESEKCGVRLAELGDAGLWGLGFLHAPNFWEQMSLPQVPRPGGLFHRPFR